MAVTIDPEKLREESKIYPNLVPGSFLYNYRKALNDAAYELCLENASLVYNKGQLQTLAKAKVDESGYLYTKKKSRSQELSIPRADNLTPKLTPSLRAKRIENIEEDLQEVNLEMSLLERSRAKARNLNQDERARSFTQEMTPPRQRKRKLEDELSILQKKEAKSLRQKKMRKPHMKDAQNRADDKQLNSKSQRTLDEVLDEGQASNDVEILEVLDAVDDSTETSKESEANREVVSNVEESQKVASEESFL